MEAPRVVLIFLTAFPLLASGQTPTADVQTLQRRQEELETQVREQGARIQELERLLRQQLSEQAPGAPAVTPTETAAQPATSSPQGRSSETTRAPAVNPGPEYVANQGFKLYESDKGQIYMRLFSYARYLRDVEGLLGS